VSDWSDLGADPGVGAGPGPAARRLDPRTLVARLVTLSAIRQYWGALLPLAAVLGFRGGRGVVGVLLVLLLLAALSAGAAVLEWWRTSYEVRGGRLLVERGLLSRSLTVVPVDRVRGVDVHASALQRLLGIVTVRVDAAASGAKDDEAVLDAVSRAEADRLRGILLRAGPVEPGAPAGEVLARFRPRWLLYAPLVGTYLLAPLAAAGALAQVAGDVRLPLPVRRWLDDAVGARPSVTALVLLAAAVVLVAVAGAVVTAGVANWGFTLTRRGGTLVAERGLLSRRQVSLEHDRVRGYALAEPLALRAVRAARLTALVTGLGGGDDEGGTGRRGQLLPLGPAAEARRVAGTAVVRFDPPLRPHPAAARRRRLARAIVPWLVPAAVLAGFGLWWPAAGFGLLALLGVPLGLDRYAGLGTATDGRAVSVRGGSLRRRQVVLVNRGVVGATVRQTFFQRQAGLVTVTVATGAGSGGYAAVDLAAADAVPLLRATGVAPLTTLEP
jgi:putative membrane protein